MKHVVWAATVALVAGLIICFFADLNFADGTHDANGWDNTATGLLVVWGVVLGLAWIRSGREER